VDAIDRDYPGHNESVQSADTGANKEAVRAAVLAARRQRGGGEIAAQRAQLRALVLARCVREGWRCVAAYEPMRTEPGSVELLAGWHGLGISVLIPTLLPDNDLDWAHWHPDPDRPRPALGPAAIASAEAVFVPALAVARDGVRLGRGGGSYDRALARVGDVPVVALLFDGELVDGLPHDQWDRSVSAVATPSGWTDL
jgi:5-formyltetrahydrofolate cyclo-ligase